MTDDLETLKLYGFQRDMLPDVLVLRKDTRAMFILFAAAAIGLLITLGFTYFLEGGDLENFELDWEILIGPAIAVLASPLISVLVERFIPDDLILDREGFLIQGSTGEKIPWDYTGSFEISSNAFWVDQVITYLAPDKTEAVSNRIFREDLNRLTINAVYGRLAVEELARVMNAYRDSADMDVSQPE